MTIVSTDNFNWYNNFFGALQKQPSEWLINKAKQNGFDLLSHFDTVVPNSHLNVASIAKLQQDHHIARLHREIDRSGSRSPERNSRPLYNSSLKSIF